MQLQGESWDNLGELGRGAEICVDLWGAVESLQRAVGIFCVYGHVMYRNPILGLCYSGAGVVLWLRIGINSQMQ